MDITLDGKSVRRSNKADDDLLPILAVISGIAVFSDNAPVSLEVTASGSLTVR